MDDKIPETDIREFTVLDTQAVKGVAILLMMWHHLFGFPAYHSYQTLLPVNFAYYLGLFGKICVAIYLFLSGYGLAKSAGKQTGSLGLRTVQRLRQFYAGYWLYFAICVPYGLFVLGDLHGGGGGGLEAPSLEPQWIRNGQ